MKLELPKLLLSENITIRSEKDIIKAKAKYMAKAKLKIGDSFQTCFDNNVYKVHHIDPNFKLGGGYCYYTTESNGKEYVCSKDIRIIKFYVLWYRQLKKLLRHILK